MVVLGHNNHSYHNTRLGQCFLVDKSAKERIFQILSQELDQKASVLEIGAGSGVLTEILLDIGISRVLAIELDKRWVECLRERFKGEKRLRIIQGDFRKLDINGFLKEKFYMISNIPYYITGDVLEFAYLNTRLLSAYLMLQKDILDKVTSMVGFAKYSALSVIIQVFFSVEELFTLPPKSFSPAPKVWSSFVRFEVRKEMEGVDLDRRKEFVDIIKRAFSHRRKMLKHNLGGEIIDSVPANWLSKRAQEISPQEWWDWFVNMEGKGGKIY